MKSIVVFVGAGASRGVSEEKYPMALDFRRRLPDTITKQPLFTTLDEHLRGSGLNEQVDIEHVLLELNRLHDSAVEWTTVNHFASRLLRKNNIETITQLAVPGPQIHQQFEALRQVVAKLQDQINERVYDYYSQSPDKQELERSWLPLLRWLGAAGFASINVVTTNYDLVIESALEAMSSAPVNTGFRGGLLPGIDLEAWRGTDMPMGMLTKLHGSVDWKLGNGSTDVNPVIRRGHPEFDGDHGKRLILYPGFKGVPSREPFVSFHDYFRRTLQSATHVLFIGFAFRDEYINSIIAAALQPSSRVAVVDPIETLPGKPFLTNALHMKQWFGHERSGSVLALAGRAPFVTENLDDWIISDG